MNTILAVATSWVLLAPAAMGACTISKISELAVVDNGRRPIVEGRINGQPVRALIDTGAYMTSVGAGEAKRLGLVTETTGRLAVFGVGGRVRASVAQLASLEIGLFTGRKVLVAVLDDGSTTREIDHDMILGMDLLSRVVLEMDLANGVIRFLKDDGCKPEQLVYWAKSWSQVDIEALSSDNPHISFAVVLNGVKTPAYLDSGAAVSFATSDAVRRAGIPRGATAASEPSTGINGKSIETWLVTADTFSIGDDETIRNVKLRVGDLFAGDTYEETGSHVRHQIELPGMLIGHDFLQTHRAVILFKERKLFLTYSGGAVFQTVVRPVSAAAPAASN